MKKRDKPTRLEIIRVMSWLGARTSPKKAAAVRENGKLGGRPKSSKNNR